MRVQVEQVRMSGTVATCVGIDVDTGARVAFYAEHRAAAAIAEQVAGAEDRDGLPVADLERWQSERLEAVSERWAHVWPNRGSVEDAIRSAEPGSLTADDFLTLSCKTDRNDSPGLLVLAWKRGVLAPGALAGAAVDAWSSAEYPQEALGRSTWLELFAEAGFSVDGRPAERPAEPVALYRGATHNRRRLMAWTTDRDVAESFAFGGIGGRGAGQVWTTTAPPAALLAVVGAAGREGEREYIVDTRGLTIVPAPEST